MDNVKVLVTEELLRQQRKMGNRLSRRLFSAVILIAILIFTAISLPAGEPSAMTPEEVLKIKSVSEAAISPDGNWIAYTVNVPRSAADEPGGAYRELYLISARGDEPQPFVTGEVSVYSPQWSPDGKHIAFRSHLKGEKTTQVWVIPTNGGEARQATWSPTGVSYFQWHPSGTQIGYIAVTPESFREKALEKKGYNFVYFEENLKDRNLYMVNVDFRGEKKEARQVTHGATVWDFEFSPTGKSIAATVSSKNLIDYRYMFRKIELIDPETGQMRELTGDEPRKLGNYAFSPDGTRLVYAAAVNSNDNNVSQAYVLDIASKDTINLTIPKYRGHIEWVGWKDKNTVLYFSGEGVWNTLSLVKASGGERKVILNSLDTGIIFDPPSYTSNFKGFALVGDTPQQPSELYHWQPGKDMQKLTTENVWLTEKKFGKQEIIRYPARDGLDIEGILVYPVGYEEGARYPLIVSVHGGPESHHTNGWLNGYFHPSQVLSGRGYFTFYPNYRASTGYGVKFAMQGFGDAAGKEFDDIADGIDYLVNQGLVDSTRVGLGGGSYGGYASAWFASYYTKYVRAVAMFVGISDLISKRGTTDIAWEELYVHSGKKLEDMWKLSLERSPIYYAHQSKTAVLILGGTDDPRVNPGQSLEFYRRLKMTGHPATRLVQYPGEQHGNRKQPGRIDVLYRHLAWYDWYVKDKKPLDGPMPPLDLSRYYGLDLPE